MILNRIKDSLQVLKNAFTLQHKNANIFVISATVLILIGLISTTIALQNNNHNTAQAATINSVEPEEGTITGNITIENDTNASGGKYIKFGTSNVTPTPTPSTPVFPTPDLANSINVRDLGAKGDGVSDDTTAIASGIANAKSSGKALVIPSGTYIVNQTFILDSSVWIYGQEGSILRAGSSQTGDLAHRGWHFAVTAPDVTVQGLTIVAPVVPYLNDFDEVASVHVMDAPRARILDNTFTGSEGIFVKGPTTVDTQVIGNRLSGGPGIVYTYAGASRTLVANNVIDGSKGNAMSGTGNHGSAFNSGAIVENNIITNAGRMGIEDWGNCVDTIIRGNRIVRPGVLSDDAGFAISAVGIRQIVQDNDIDDYEIYGIEASGNGTKVLRNNVLQNGSARGTGTAVIINGHLANVTSGAEVIGNIIEANGIAVSVWSNAGLVHVEANSLIDNLVGVAVDSQDPLTGFEAINNTVTYNTPPVAVGSRRAFDTYSTGNTGVKSTLISNNTVTYNTGAWSEGASEDEWLAKIATDNVEISGNTFDAGSNHPATFIPKIGGNGATNSGLVVRLNRFLNGAQLDISWFTNPTVENNTFE